jgi:hypothetical protein
LQQLCIGNLELPEGADIATFLLTDGRQQRHKAPTPAAP